MSASVAAAAFYVGLVALVAGAGLSAGAAVRQARPPAPAFAALGIGACAIVFAIVAYATGPRGTLPF